MDLQPTVSLATYHKPPASPGHATTSCFLRKQEILPGKGRPPGHCGASAQVQRRGWKPWLSVRTWTACDIPSLLGGTNIYAAFSTFNFSSFPQKLSNYVFLEVHLDTRWPWFYSSVSMQLRALLRFSFQLSPYPDALNFSIAFVCYINHSSQDSFSLINNIKLVQNRTKINGLLHAEVIELTWGLEAT